MKESTTQKLPKHFKDFYLSHKKELDPFLDHVFTEPLEKAYLASIEEESQYSDAISNYAVKIAYHKGYQASLLKQLKLLDYNLKKLIPNEWRVV